jgi:hypothetical protein
VLIAEPPWDSVSASALAFPCCHPGVSSLIELGRFDEAIVAAKKAQRQKPASSATCCCLAAAFAHLGRDAEARVLEFDPAFTMSAWSGSERAIKGEASD